ncbi:hypothetical protein BH24DEI2_BH24DEI2_05490 [soil metagenome]
MHLKEPYRPRRTEFLELLESEGWRLKLYSVRYGDKDPDVALDIALVAAAKAAALRFLPRPAVTPDHYGLGFVSVHQGKSYDFVTVAYWCYDTELRQQTYSRPSSLSPGLEPVDGELSLDIWDLRVLAFERDAWLNAVLRPPTPDPDAYLQRRLNETA